jgi:uncharacterized protein
MRLELFHTPMVLSSLKCIYLEEWNTLVCADIHIGKGGHFRRNGIGLPSMLNKNNFWNLSKVFDGFKPKHLVVLGDMVHSRENHEWHDYTDFLDNYPGISRFLIRGNHELYGDEHYERLGFRVLPSLQYNDLMFSHEPMLEIPRNKLNICGHLHPAIRLQGNANQSLRLPCFWIRPNQLVLPAFGEFTGMHVVRPKSGDRVVAVARQQLIEIPSNK